MDTGTYLILVVAAGFIVGVAWDRWHLRERHGYRVPVRERVISVAAVRDPRPGLPCSNLHGSVEPGCRCPVCGERIGRTDG
jgi:hypothetical protein